MAYSSKRTGSQAFNSKEAFQEHLKTSYTLKSLRTRSAGPGVERGERWAKNRVKGPLTLPRWTDRDELLLNAHPNGIYQSFKDGHWYHEAYNPLMDYQVKGPYRTRRLATDAYRIMVIDTNSLKNELEE